MESLTSKLTAVQASPDHFTCSFTQTQIALLDGDHAELMISNFVDGAARFYVNNVVTVSTLSILTVPLFVDDV